MLVECVPNFSEGRRPERIRAIAEAIAGVESACVLDTHIDPDHNRSGITFVPIGGVTMDDCVRLAHEAGGTIARELSIPVYFYEKAARRPERVNLEDVRRGALELLREEIVVKSERAPDEGLAQVHDSEGADAVGARPLLIAFNVILRREDIAAAR